MKNTFTTRLKTTATRIHAAGKKATQHPVASILSLCVLAGVGATIITYSQPISQTNTPLALPAENVELVDVIGRKITVTVLNRDAKGITIRLANGKETHLDFSKLNTATCDLLTGKTAEKKIIPKQDTPVLTEKKIIPKQDTPVLTEKKIIPKQDAPVLTEKKIIPKQDAPLVLPAENVELGFESGHKITATVLNMTADKESIIIRTKDYGTESVLMTELDAHTTKKLTGIDPPKKLTGIDPPKKLSYEEKRAKNIEKMKRRAELCKRFNQMTAKDLLKLLKENDPDLLFVLDAGMNCYINEVRFHRGKDPNIERRFHPGIELLKKIEIKDEDEKVSLRPEFERLGMVAHQQKGYTCYQHASYHMYQYQLRKNNLPVPSYEKFIKMTGGGVGDPTAIINFKPPIGQQISVQLLDIGRIKPFSDEMIKHLLRNGKPCIIDGYFPQGSHIVLAIGFVVKNGITTFEYLDSNRVWQDKGYRLYGPETGTKFLGMMSVWFDQTK